MGVREACYMPATISDLLLLDDLKHEAFDANALLMGLDAKCPT